MAEFGSWADVGLGPPPGDLQAGRGVGVDPLPWAAEEPFFPLSIVNDSCLTFDGLCGL